MSDEFDPYLKWLAIPPEEQPANYYRLLGVPLYIDDPDVIGNAADQRSTHLRSFQAGQRSELSQQILNEIAQARVCLLNADQKATYDKQLRQTLSPAPAPPAIPIAPPTTSARQTASIAPPTPVLRPEPTPASQPTAATVAARTPTRRRPKKRNPTLQAAFIVIGGVVGIGIGWVIFSLMFPQALPTASSDSQETASTETHVDSARTKATSVDDSNATDTESQDATATNVRPSEQAATTNIDETATVEPAEPTNDVRVAELTAKYEAAMTASDWQLAATTLDELEQLTDVEHVSTARLKLALAMGSQAASQSASRAAATMLIDTAESLSEERRAEMTDSHLDAMLLSARRSEDNELVRRATRLILLLQGDDSPIDAFITPFVGNWLISYSNKSQREYEIKADGQVTAITDPKRKRGELTGTIYQQGADILISLRDNKLESVTVNEGILHVQHYNPASHYPGHRPAATGKGEKRP